MTTKRLLTDDCILRDTERRSSNNLFTSLVMINADLPIESVPNFNGAQRHLDRTCRRNLIVSNEMNYSHTGTQSSSRPIFFSLFIRP